MVVLRSSAVQTILRWNIAGVKIEDGSTNESLNQRQAHRVSLLFASLIFRAIKKFLVIPGG